MITLAPGRLGEPPQRRREPLQLGHPVTLTKRLPQQVGGEGPVAASHRQVAQDELRGDLGGDAAAPVGEGLLRGLGGRLPLAGGPLDVREVRCHVVPVIPQLDLLGVADALGEPALGQVVLHQRRCGRPDHPVSACRLRLLLGAGRAGDRAFKQPPAFLHPAGEDQHRSERGGGVESGLVVAYPLAFSAAGLAVRNGLVEAVIHQVGSGHRGAQPCPLAIGTGHAVQAVQRRLQQADPGGQVLAEQVRDRDHARYQCGRRAHVTGAGRQFVRRPVGLGGGRVVVGGRGLVAERGEQPGPVERRKLDRQVAHRPPVQFQGFAVGGDRRGLTRGGDRVLVGEPGAICLLEVR